VHKLGALSMTGGGESGSKAFLTSAFFICGIGITVKNPAFAFFL
jgi:hypothetical protein